MVKPATNRTIGGKEILTRMENQYDESTLPFELLPQEVLDLLDDDVDERMASDELSVSQISFRNGEQSILGFDQTMLSLPYDEHFRTMLYLNYLQEQTSSPAPTYDSVLPGQMSQADGYLNLTCDKVYGSLYPTQGLVLQGQTSSPALAGEINAVVPVQEHGGGHVKEMSVEREDVSLGISKDHVWQPESSMMTEDKCGLIDNVHNKILNAAKVVCGSNTSEPVLRPLPQDSTSKVALVSSDEKKKKRREKNKESQRKSRERKKAEIKNEQKRMVKLKQSKADLEADIHKLNENLETLEIFLQEVEKGTTNVQREESVNGYCPSSVASSSVLDDTEENIDLRPLMNSGERVATYLTNSNFTSRDQSKSKPLVNQSPWKSSELNDNEEMDDLTSFFLNNKSYNEDF